MRILIVDDELVSREKLRNIMDSFGQCIVVENGADALRVATSQNPPDLILLDIIMPGIDGYEVCKRLKANRRTSNIPVIFVSSRSGEDDEAQGLGLGAVDYITKPFSPSIVKARVRTHFELKKHHNRLEELVNERTVKLKKATKEMQVEIAERKQAEDNLKQANEKLLSVHNQRKILSKRLIDLLEKDRHDIAMELHDHIGQTLTSLKLNLETIHAQLEPTESELGSHIKAAKEKAINALKDIKSISHGLKPSILDTLGLKPSLRELFNDIQRDMDIKIKFFSRNISKEIAPEKELAIYRITQEALTNVIKHARAKEVFVNLIKKEKNISLSIEDDGVGFNPDKTIKVMKRKGPLGLLIMQERAIQLDGEFTVESQIGQGTHVLVGIPL